MYKDIEILLNEYKYLPIMIRNVDLELYNIKVINNYSREKEFLELKELYETKISNIEYVLKKLEEKERKVIELKYFKINANNWEAIADEMGYSKSYCNKLRNIALERIHEIFSFFT